MNEYAVLPTPDVGMGKRTMTSKSRKAKSKPKPPRPETWLRFLAETDRGELTIDDAGPGEQEAFMDWLATDALLNQEEAALVLGLRPETLRKWRQNDQGPAFERVLPVPGGLRRLVRYRYSVLRAWIDAAPERAALPPSSRPLRQR